MYNTTIYEHNLYGHSTEIFFVQMLGVALQMKVLKAQQKLDYQEDDEEYSDEELESCQDQSLEEVLVVAVGREEFH